MVKVRYRLSRCGRTPAPTESLPSNERSPVEYIRLGGSGLRVSRLALGCMSFGDPRPATPWTLDRDAAAPIFCQ